MKIAFLGCGNMAQSLIGGLIGDGFNPADIVVADPEPKATDMARQKWQVAVAEDNNAAVTLADVIVLAIKPQQMKTVLTSLTGSLKEKLLISIAAGVQTSDMRDWAGKNTTGTTAIVRCMPNTPALLQQGATGLYADNSVSDPQRTAAEKILAAAGATAWVDSEEQLDAITALSGSGPAYFFLLIESMTNAAINLGLPKTLATNFAVQTALGAAQMAADSGLEPAQLRENVTSPAGTTEAALNSFNNDNFTQTVQSAMQAAKLRAQELSKELGGSDG